MAAPTSIAQLTSVISFSDVSLGLLTVAALFATVYVLMRSVRMVLSVVRGETERSSNSFPDSYWQNEFEQYNSNPLNRDLNEFKDWRDMRDYLS